MQVKVDKRVEFMNMIQQISECQNKQKHPNMFIGAKVYVDKIYNDFGKFANHEVMELYSQFEFGLTTAEYLARDLDENYNFTYFENINASERFIKFLTLLPKFAKDIEFDKWFESNKNFYDAIIKDYSEFLNKSHFEEFLRWFYKTDFDESYGRGFCLMPSLSNCNMCIFHGNEIICHVSIQPTEDDKVYFVLQEKAEEGNAHTAVHEFSHFPVVNKMADSYFNEHELFSIETEKSKEVGVYHGQSMFVDTIIEAVVQTYMRKNGFLESADNRLQEWQETGFIYIKPAYDCIQEYVKNIDNYDAFSEFFPMVIERLFNEKENKLNYQEN